VHDVKPFGVSPHEIREHQLQPFQNGNALYRWSSSSSVLSYRRRHGAACYSKTRRRRSALLTTETELNAIAAPAKIGENSSPKKGVEHDPKHE
jgi:hypothetical protein